VQTALDRPAVGANIQEALQGSHTQHDAAPLRANRDAAMDSGKRKEREDGLDGVVA
jgi:hypothetical protein